jgi:hypothetical protein
VNQEPINVLYLISFVDANKKSRKINQNMNKTSPFAASAEKILAKQRPHGFLVWISICVGNHALRA